MKLSAEQISFSYEVGNRRILSSLSLEIKSGDRIGVVAPSGFGKTTLCKILAGYEKPDSGKVLLDGKSLEKFKGKCPVQMIWQHPEQSVDPRWKLKQVLSAAGMEDADLIRRLGIKSEWLERFPAELSGGELQRFCIARALGSGTEFLLADEITAMLDLVTQSEIWQVLLSETRRRNLGMLVVSHSEGLLDKVCTKVIDLQEKDDSFRTEENNGCKGNA